MKTKFTVLTFVLTTIAAFSAASAQTNEQNPDYRIRAQFRSNSGESVGNAEFRVIDRYGHVYYGGVVRQDEFRFKVELSSGQYAYNLYDVYVFTQSATEGVFMGTVEADLYGFTEVTWRSDYKDSDDPDRPLPSSFPDMVDVGDSVAVYEYGTDNLVVAGSLKERYRRGDSNGDDKVDGDDFSALEANFGLNAFGPANGDFSGDGVVDMADYDLLVANWTDDPSAIPPAPTTGSTSVEGSADEISLAVGSVYPNPVNRSGAIAVDVSSPAFVDVRIFDLMGREVRSVHRGLLPAGRREIGIAVDGLAAGVYFLSVKGAGLSAARTFLVQ